MTINDLDKAMNKLNSLITDGGTKFYYSMTDGKSWFPETGVITSKKFRYSIISQKTLFSITRNEPFEFPFYEERGKKCNFLITFTDKENLMYDFKFDRSICDVNNTRVIIRKNSVKFIMEDGILYIKKKQNQENL